MLASSRFGLSIVAGYLVGSIPFAWLVARWWGTADLRRVGSGNLGAANVMRVSGVAAALLVTFLDITKGAASVLIALRLTGEGSQAAVAGLAAIVGHVFPVWLGFKGGKGVATACGVFAVLMPFALAPAVATFVLAVGITKYVSLGSVLASLVLPLSAYALGYPTPIVQVALTATALIVFCHRSNIGRVITGTERRVSARESR
jgi:glycerol-3-phosphate acyltransferase PlsY